MRYIRKETVGALLIGWCVCYFNGISIAADVVVSSAEAAKSHVEDWTR